MGKLKYAEETPRCDWCHFFNEKYGCLLGKMNCYYLIDSPRVAATPCDGCNFSKGGPCIGWCSKNLLGMEGIDVREIRNRRYCS